jgi:hypothetical protein
VGTVKDWWLAETLTEVHACCGVAAGLLHVKYLAPGAAQLLRLLRQQRLRASVVAARSRPGRTAAAGGVGPSGGGAPGAPATASGPAATTSAAAAAAQQRILAQQQRGIPARREQQGQRVDGLQGDQGVSSSTRPLSAEELRLRHLQRFS